MALGGSYKKLPRDIWFLFLARVVTSAGNFVQPFLTLFLSDKMGFSPSETGRFMAISMAAFAPGALIGGRIGDRRGRKVGYLITASLFGICYGLFGCFIYVREFLFLIPLGSFFIGMSMPMLSAMVADLSTRENRKAAFSLQYLGHNLGFAVGPLLGGLLYGSRIRWLFWGDAVTTLAAVTLIGLLVKETRPEEAAVDDGVHQDERPESGSLWRVLISRPILPIFMVLVFFLNLIYAQLNYSIPLRMAEVFGSDAGPRRFGYLMSFNALFVLVCTTPLTRLTEKVSPLVLVALTGVTYGLGFGLMGFTGEYSVMILLMALLTSGEILGATNIDVFLTNRTPSSHRARLLGVAPVIMGSGLAISPLIAGRINEVSGLSIIWYLCLILGIGSAGGFMLLKRVSKNREVVTNE